MCLAGPHLGRQETGHGPVQGGDNEVIPCCRCCKVERRDEHSMMELEKKETNELTVGAVLNLYPICS